MRSTLAISIIVLGLLTAAVLVFLVRAGIFLLSAALFTGFTLFVFAALVWFWTAKRKGPADR
ncbi:MAG: hypothetical protein SFV32_03275 [Opitutaceae bacterium]|nr:hypothetical protein [Opitutaceae bacterium]